MSDGSEHPLKGLWLLRYGRDEPGLDHTMSILDAPADTATVNNADAYIEHIARLLELSPLDRSKMPKDPPGRRAYADNYIAVRGEMDGYLESRARLKGVAPENGRPLYFILHHDRNPDPPLMEGKVMIAIPAENVPVDRLTLTVDDSFYNNPKEPTAFRVPEHGTVFSAGEIADKIGKEGWLPNFPHELTGGRDIPRFFEAQLWSRRIDDFMRGPAASADQHAHLTVRPITSEDWQAYRDFYKSLKDPHMFKGFLEGRDLDARATYENLFRNTIHRGSFVMFGLWDRDKMIGQSSIDFIDAGGKKSALFAGSEIADAYRGQRLVGKFYEARKQYLTAIGFEGEVLTTIRPENHSSLKAAARNGFINTGRLDEHGYCILVPQHFVGQQQQTRNLVSDADRAQQAQQQEERRIRQAEFGSRGRSSATEPHEQKQPQLLDTRTADRLEAQRAQLAQQPTRVASVPKAAPTPPSVPGSMPAASGSAVWSTKLNGINGRIGAAAIAVNLVDAVVKGDVKQAAEVAGTAGALHMGMKGVAMAAGVRAVPVAGQVVGAVFAGKDAYDAATHGNTARAIVSGTEATLYTVAAGVGTAAALNIWNPVGWGAGAVALVAGGTAVTITAAKAVHDNWNTITGWFGYRAGDNAQTAAPDQRHSSQASLIPGKSSANGRGTLRHSHASAPSEQADSAMQRQPSRPAAGIVSPALIA